MWKEYNIVVNSLAQQVRFNDETVQNLFVPFIERIAKLPKNDGRNIIFVAAPPATGKSTLTLFLESLAKERGISLQAVGLDGFHYPNAYLAANYAEIDGRKILLRDVKGSAETFDVEAVAAKLAELKSDAAEVKWPVYSRKLHDPIADGYTITKDIVLFEGNWLLLKDLRWAALRSFADYALFITADEDTLKERLISRKVQGGVSRDEATRFYEASDSVNVKRVLADSVSADEIWDMSYDGDFCLREK